MVDGSRYYIIERWKASA